MLAPERARTLIELLDLIDDANLKPPADIAILKSALRRLILELATGT